MRAAVIEEFGGSDKIKIVDFPKPPLAPDGVMIKVAAAGVNPVDVKTRTGKQAPRFPHHFPLILGWDVAGVVERVGAAVTRFRPGDRVCAYGRKSCVEWGSYCEWFTLNEEAVAPAPGSVDLVHAAGLPLSALTAWQLVERLEVSAGRRVLVHGGSGGVGSYVVQLLKERGVEVLATSSPASHGYLESLGAIPIDRHEDVADQVLSVAPDGVDAMADLAGPEAVKATVQVVKDGGRVVSILVPPPLDSDSSSRGIDGRYIFVRPYGHQLEELVARVDRGVLAINIDRTFPLERAAEAHDTLEAGGIRGKIVLTI